VGVVLQSNFGQVDLDFASTSMENIDTQTDGDGYHVSCSSFALRFLLLDNTTHTRATFHRTTLMAGFVQFAAVFSIPLRTQLVDLKSATQAGIRLLPLVSATAVGSLIGGGSSAKKNLTFFTMTFAMALVAIGSGLLSTLPASGAETKAIFGYQVILGIGLGMSISTATFMTSMEVEFVDHGQLLTPNLSLSASTHS
jgi:hypothetical protein